MLERINEKIEPLERYQTKKRSGGWGPDQAFENAAAMPDAKSDWAGNFPFAAPFVGESHDALATRFQSQMFDDILREHQHRSASIDDRA